MPDSQQKISAIDAGLGALDRGAWQEARAKFEESIQAAPSASALEGLSWATWWLEEIDVCLAAREQAHRHYRDEGDLRGAARMALWVGDDLMGFKGAGAVAEGWTRRAARLLQKVDSCPEHGWLAVFEAHQALWGLDLDRATDLAGDAQRLGRLHQVVDLEMFGLATEGAVRVARADVKAGLSCLDEATAAAVAGDYENLVPAAWSCCLMMSACEQVRDFDRAIQWCERIEQFSRRFDARFVTGVCQAHIGAIQMWQGDWPEAEQRLLDSLTYLTSRRPTWRPEAIVRLARLRQQQGRLDESAMLLDQAEGHPLTLQIQAAIAVDRDETEGARDLLERSLRRIPSGMVTSRLDILEPLIHVTVSIGDVESSSGLLVDFREGASALSTEPFRGAIAACEGALALARKAPEAATDHFEDAIDIFTRCHVPVEAARARMRLVETLVALGRFPAAQREAAHSLSVFEKVGAAIDTVRCRTLLEQIQQPRHVEKLTSRQIEILRLIAAGRTDQEIAAELWISPHTVHRHVANIYNRLACSTRAAAVAEASRLGLL